MQTTPTKLNVSLEAMHSIFDRLLGNEDAMYIWYLGV